MSITKYQVLYTKDGAKKRKLFSDGFLIVKDGTNNTRAISLMSDDNTEVWRTTGKILASFEVGNEITLGSFLIQIDSIVSDSVESSGTKRPLEVLASTLPNLKQTKFIAPSRLLPFKPKPIEQKKINLDSSEIENGGSEAFWNQEENHDSGTPLTCTGTSSSVQTNINANLQTRRLIRETNKVIKLNSNANATKVCNRINPGRVSQHMQPSESVLTLPEQDPSLTRLMRPHQIIGADFLISRLFGKAATGCSDGSAEGSVHTGAVLADEMGVGKTLTAISAVWAILRRGGRKCLVICPSSLVDNWLKELKHWLGTRLKELSIKAGADAAAIINTFAISLPSLYPLMVLSYEMFRKHAELLNTVPGLELMVCDEGHRLKNIGGTKTMDTLRNCKAQRRVILSGTPIQNDLDELYAVVSFVAPGFFGSLSEYKARISGPLSRSNEAGASVGDKELGEEAASALRSMLGAIMLRRTQADILRALLPPRNDYLVYCVPTRAQVAEYAAVAEDIVKSIGMGQVCDTDYDSNGEAQEENRSIVSSTLVLPGLQNLRRICNSARPGGGVGGLRSKQGGFQSARNCDGSSFSNTSPGSNSSDQAAGSNAYYQSTGAPGGPGVSSKLQVLLCLLGVLRQSNPQEKIVVVSNFTTSLDDIETAVTGRFGACLRLDGKVPVDQRQSLVNRFNKADDPSFVFLLSAKAGGVGINLVGASRLVMYDVDWNPAVDHQAMSRIWREGQRFPVHIYRLVAAGMIEEAILQRQRSKTDLAGLVDDTGDIDTGRTTGQRMSLTSSDILRLISPCRSLAGQRVSNSDSSSIVNTIQQEDGALPLAPVLAEEEGTQLLQDEVLQRVVTRLGSQWIHGAFQTS